MGVAAGEMELDKVDCTIISMTTIVHDDAFEYESSNIRQEHLSFEKFCLVLERSDPNFDFRKKGAALTWEVVLGSGQVQQKGINDEGEFQRAVGTLAWTANEKGLGKVLVMHIRPHCKEGV